MKTLLEDLSEVLNNHHVGARSDINAVALAEYLLGCVNAFQVICDRHGMSAGYPGMSNEIPLAKSLAILTEHNWVEPVLSAEVDAALEDDEDEGN